MHTNKRASDLIQKVLNSRATEEQNHAKYKTGASIVFMHPLQVRLVSI
jgi:hypothetical protein